MDLKAHKQTIGAFLVSIGALTQKQVNDVLIRQKEGDTRLFGEIAISLQYFDDYAIRRYIDYVELIRQADKSPPTPQPY